ncbi:sensor histidine kinase [Geothrix sp. PMB-07]|uniref:sensor histidine kinase n=1 Tax=Geothrix sp. PMB-07 TaxID=3068640 RepID=UPI0027427A71|nr:histidine kinase [Geothrix sp. PMB-07]WLT30922.1 histidine kinase [Geothrix sp. PMB-07]
MTTPDITTIFIERSRQPIVLGITILITFVIFYFELKTSSFNYRFLFKFIIRFLLLIFHIHALALFSPLPWLWSGDSSLRPSLLKGFTQSLIFSSAIFLINLLRSYTSIKELTIIIQTYSKSNTQAKATAISICISILMILVYCAIGYILARFELLRLLKNKAHAQASEVAWAPLNAQVTPHMLLNCLNGIIELMNSSPIDGYEAMIKLVEFHRLFEKLSTRRRIPISLEYELLLKYIEVEKIRYKSNLNIEIAIDPATREIQIPPLIIQQLLENAIKHGDFDRHGIKQIKVSIIYRESQITSEIINLSLAPFGSHGNGIGLMNIKGRLQIAYEGLANFKIEHLDGWVYAKISFPRTI